MADFKALSIRNFDSGLDWQNALFDYLWRNAFIHDVDTGEVGICEGYREKLHESILEFHRMGWLKKANSEKSPHFVYVVDREVWNDGY